MRLNKAKEHLPSAIRYNKIQDWSKLIIGDKGKFLKNKRTTFSDELAMK